MPPVRFRFRHRAASTVAVAGDFNRWSTAAHLLERATDDLWALEVDLPPGRHEYKFFVDGREWWNDPEAPKVRNIWGSENSYVDVSVATGPDQEFRAGPIATAAPRWEDVRHRERTSAAPKGAAR